MKQLQKEKITLVVPQRKLVDVVSWAVEFILTVQQYVCNHTHYQLTLKLWKIHIGFTFAYIEVSR